jgi:hypothetical protein
MYILSNHEVTEINGQCQRVKINCPDGDAVPRQGVRLGFGISPERLFGYKRGNDDSQYQNCHDGRGDNPHTAMPRCSSS